jgi:hypothetical protein
MARRQSFFTAFALVFLVGILWTWSSFRSFAPIMQPSGSHMLSQSLPSSLVHAPSFPTPAPCQIQATTRTVIQYATVYLNGPHYEPEPIVLTFVTMGASSAREGSVAIKSALMHTSRPLHIHIICSSDAQEYHQTRFALFSRPMYPVQVTFYVITGDDVRKRCDRAGIGRNYNLLVKTLIHELLADVEKTIFVDTDMIFMGGSSCRCDFEIHLIASS